VERLSKRQTTGRDGQGFTSQGGDIGTGLWWRLGNLTFQYFKEFPGSFWPDRPFICRFHLVTFR